MLRTPANRLLNHLFLLRMHVAVVGLASFLASTTCRTGRLFPKLRSFSSSSLYLGSRKLLHNYYNNNNNELVVVRRTCAARTSDTTMAARTALDEHGAKGEFVRKDAAWRNWVKNGT
jgi:hypothetical protein